MDITLEHAIYRGAVNMSLHHTHETYEVYCLLRGKRIFNIYGRQYLLHPGHVAIIPNGIPHKSSSLDAEEQERVCIVVKPSFFQNMLENSETLISMLRSMPLVIVPTEEEQAMILGLVQHMLDQSYANLDSLMQELSVKTDFFQLFRILYSHIAPLYHATSAMEQQAFKESDTIFRDLISYLQANFRQHITLDTLAEHFHLSRSRLSSKLNRFLGTSWVTYINTLRINEAQNLMNCSYSNISEIAASVGFDSLTHFERVFKSLLGQTPSQYIMTLKTGQQTHSHNELNNF